MSAGLSPERDSEIRGVLRDGRWCEVTVADWARIVQELIADNDRLRGEAAGMDRVASAGPAIRAAENARSSAEAERDQARRELDSYERLTEQSCPKGKHADWLVDSENHHACPWCQIDALESVKSELEDRLTARIAEDAARPSSSDTLHAAAAAVAVFTGNPLDANAKMLRRWAAGMPRAGDPLAVIDGAPAAGAARDAVLAEVVAWLGKKAREYEGGTRRESTADALRRMADKISRGAIRPTEAGGRP